MLTLTDVLGESLTGRQSPPLLTIEQVPPSFREPAIHTGYRPQQCTAYQCVASVFDATNETLNFWTHFIPTWYFVWKLKCMTDVMDFANDPYTYGLFTYMLTICLYPLISCTAHAFSSLSDRARHICYFLDYGALSIYSYGSGILYRSYVLPSDWLETGSGSSGDLFMYGCILSSVLCTFCACCSRFTQAPLLLKILRLGAFALPFAWVSTPLLYRLIYCDYLHDCEAASLPHHLRQFVVAFSGALVYALHFPERLAPGKFDIVGHSHQWLHVFGILATLEQLNAGLLDLHERREVITANGWMMADDWSFRSAAFVVLCDAIIIAGFSVFVMRRAETDDKDQNVKKKVC